MREAPDTGPLFIAQVRIRIMHRLAILAGADFKKNCRLVAAVFNGVAVRHPCLEPGAVTIPEQRLALLFPKHDLTRDHDDKLVIHLMPVPKRGL